MESEEAMQPEIDVPSYPAVRLMLRYGNAIAVAAALLVAACGLWAALGGWGWGFALVGILAALLLYVLLRSYREVIQIVTNTLLPQ
ncbi:MAG: hypothetical protein ACLPKB_17935 [Xanthobacteraceae bacterium]